MGIRGVSGTEGETPVAVEKLLVDTDSLYTFGGTGVKVNFSGVGGSDNVTVEKFDSVPAIGSDNNIEEDNLSQFRYVINRLASCMRVEVPAGETVEQNLYMQGNRIVAPPR